MAKKKVLVITLLVLGVLLIWGKKRHGNESMVDSQATPQGGIQIVDPKQEEASRERTEKYTKIVNWDQSERKIDLKRTPVPIENGEAVLQVEVATKGTCFPGDANAIEMDLKASPDHKLMATIENLSGEGKSMSWDLPTDFLGRGLATKTFKLPVRLEPTQFGFYLCTANKSESSCRGKNIRDINEVFTEHIRRDPQAGKETRTLFFQYMMLDERGLAAFSHYKNDDKKFEELKTYAKDRQMQSRNPAQEIDDAKKKMNTLLSYPFVFDGKRIKVELPQYNVAACGAQGK